MFKRFRNWAVLAFCGVLAALAPAARAQESSSFEIDTSKTSEAVTELKDSISDFFTGDLMQAVMYIVGAAVVIWLFFLGWKLVKKAGQKAG